MDSVVVVESWWRRAWLCVANPVAQCDVSEDGLNDRWVFDGGDDAQAAIQAAAIRRIAVVALAMTAMEW